MKKFFLSSIFIVFFLFFSSVLFGQEEKGPAYEEWPGALGLSFSTLAGNPGYGIHYHYTLGKWGFNATLGGYLDPDNTFYSDYFLYYAIYSTVQYRVYGHKFTDRLSSQLYTWFLLGHLGYMDWVSSLSEDGVYSSSVGDYRADYLVGLGIGIEVIFSEHLSIPLDFGYVGEFPNDLLISFSFGSGIRYRF